MYKDNLRFGLVLGFIAPILAMFLYYIIQFRNLATIGEFIHIILVQRTLLTALVSVSLMANAAIFTLYINKRKDRTAKGIFIATCIYGVASLLWKYVF
jgi:NADH:ubiquinone oxidoreductase subunit K